MNPKIKGYLAFLLRLVITFSILFYLFQKTDFEKLKEIWQNISFFYYFIALGVFFSFQILIALRWKKICLSWNFEDKFSFFLKAYFMGFSLNTVMPGIVGGDILRSFLLTKKGLSWKKASFSVILDRGYGLLGIFIILALSLPLKGYFLPYSFLILLEILTYSLLILYFSTSLFLSKKEGQDFLKPVCLPYNIFPIFLGFLIQILFVFQFIFLALALRLNFQSEYFFVIIPVISFLSALPISIAGLGIREGSLSYFFSLLNYPIEYGLSLGLLGYSLILISALPGLYFYLREKSLWK